MKITAITSHVLQYELPERLGYSQQYYDRRTAHLVEVTTDAGITGWGECFGPGNVALANAGIMNKVICPLVIGDDALAREVIWHKVYNLLRDHGRMGMPMQCLSGLDIALWDIAGKVAGLPLSKLIGGNFRSHVPTYGYGMMLRPEPIPELCARFRDEAMGIRDAGFVACKMKIGRGPRDDARLATAVRTAVGDDFPFMADANHCYDVSDAFHVGHALEELGAAWFEEPVAPEDREGYRELRAGLKINIAGGEGAFTRWGWRRLLEARALDIAQPEVCALGGISEYLRVLGLCHAHFTPLVNHVWGSAVTLAVNLHLLAAMPPLPGGLFAREPMLECDTTDNRFRDDLLEVPLDIMGQLQAHGGKIAVPDGPGLGIAPDRDFMRHYRID